MSSQTLTSPAEDTQDENKPFDDQELTPKQLQKWDDTNSMMAWRCGGFQAIWYRMLSTSHNGRKARQTAIMSDQIPVAATDGQNLILNPKRYFEMSLTERVFVAAHEIVHNMYGDVELLHRCARAGTVPTLSGGTLPFDNDTMQKAMDLRINALLVDSKIGTMPKGAYHDEKLGKASDSVLEVYERCYKKKQETDGGDEEGGSFDKLLPPGKSTGQNPSQVQRNAQQWSAEIARARTIEQNSSHGKMAGALKRMFQELLQPEVPWTEHIRGLINRTVGSGNYNWRKGDRRYIGRDIFLPSQSGFGCGHIVCWGDTSGSRGDKDLQSNMAELSGILEDVKPKRITVLWCDASISYVDELEDSADLAKVQARGTGGGGGTSMHPVFEWIQANCHEPPDMFIGFTDGYVDFPDQKPAFPVIWASSTDHKYPWGDVVRVNKVVRV